MTRPNVLIRNVQQLENAILLVTEIAQYKKILHRSLLLFALRVSLGFLRIEVGIILTSTSVFIVVVLIILVLVVVALVI